MRVSAEWIRRQVAALMNETATVQRTVRASQGDGKWTEVQTTVVADEPCRIAPLTAREIELAFRRGYRVDHAGVFGPTVELKPEYRVQDSRGRHFVVQEVIVPSIADTYQKAVMYQDQMGP